ncbi:imidazole glycerol phosphate synthase subunit HisH [SAR86 cluster bacterium]|nr:imidazole glycerol phosphate synthase subunit HisH [SAR86 cluster bacterium]
MSIHKVGLVNCGSGNYGSVANSLTYLNIDYHEVSHPDDFKDLSHIILPGVGSFGEVMSKLKDLDILDILVQTIKEGNLYYLGICVGMQILVDQGLEFGKHQGLGLIKGECAKIDVSSKDLRLPHIGWNEVTFQPDNPLFKDISISSSFYFLHSYEVLCPEAKNTIATCVYADDTAAAIQHKKIFGVQFHPEKSQTDGLKLIKNFCELEEGLYA